jgi:hypothetical protein
MSGEFNVFLSHNSQDKPAVRELAVALRKRGLRVWLDEDELRPGIGGLNSLEDGIRVSASVAVLIGKDGLGPWEDEEMQAALRLAVEDRRPVIPVILPDAPRPPDRPLFLNNRTWVDLRPALSEDGLNRLVWGITNVKPDPQPPIRTHCPYPGLRPFKRDESPFFFGRERETDALMARLRDSDRRFLAILGTSGTAKSSLVEAGLLPRLIAGASKGGAVWLVVRVTPGSHGNNPFLALASELLASELGPRLSRDTDVRPKDLAEELRETPANITECITKCLDQGVTTQPPAQLLLFVDQLEELFTQTQEVYCEKFLDLLTKAAQHSQVRVLATLRANFLHQVFDDKKSYYAELAALLHIHVLGPPDRHALTDMLRRPAERVGVQLEDELVKEILNDAGDDVGALPLVAFCLKELYRAVGNMTLAAYQKMERLYGAISKHGEELLADWQQKEGVSPEAPLQIIFWGLVTVSANGKVFRRRAYRNELNLDVTVEKLIEALIKGRLLITSKSTDPTCMDATVELTHSALLDKGSRLNAWIERTRPDMLLWAELGHDAGNWLNALQDRDRFLWRGRRLKKAQGSLRERPTFLSEMAYPLRTLDGLSKHRLSRNGGVLHI